MAVSEYNVHTEAMGAEVGTLDRNHISIQRLVARLRTEKRTEAGSVIPRTRTRGHLP